MPVCSLQKCEGSRVDIFRRAGADLGGCGFWLFLKRGLQPLVINEPHLTSATYTTYAYGQHDVAGTACSYSMCLL